MRYYSVASAAELLDISKSTVSRMIRRGEIAAVNMPDPNGKARWRISDEAIRAYMDSLAPVEPADAPQVGVA